MPHPTDIIISVPACTAEMLVHALTAAAARPQNDPRIDTIVATMKDILTMSTTISQQQDASTSKLVTDLDAIKTGIAGLQAQIAAGQGAVGTTITQAQEDALAAAVVTADALAAAFTTAPTPPAPTPPVTVVFNSADPTPNSAGGRNSSHLTGFDATLPETA